MQDHGWYIYDPEYQLYLSQANGTFFRSEYDEAVPVKTFEDAAAIQREWPHLEIYYVTPQATSTG